VNTKSSLIDRLPPRLKALTPCCLMALLLVAVLQGCSLLQSTVDIPVRAVKAVLPGGVETEPVDPIDLQEDMLRFADNFVLSTSKAAEKLSHDGQPIKRFELLTIKVALASDVYGLATGSNALANLVGLTVLASGARARVQDYWFPKVYGISADPMLQSLEEREKEIWAIARRVLKPEMLEELKEAIDKWRKTSGDPLGDLEAFASNSLVSDVTKGFSKSRSSSSLPSSVFALLDIDPLAGLDPATRELTETRLFAERALFMGQRMPQLIEWQMELLALQSAAMPQITQVVDGGTKIADASERMSMLMDRFPSLISQEREKIIASLRTEIQELLKLSREVGLTLESGHQMASATDLALKSYDAILTHLDQQPKDPNAPPFDIKDYAKAAHEISTMSERINEVLKTLGMASEPAQISQLKTHVEALSTVTLKDGKALVDYAFMTLLTLALVIALLTVVSLVFYQWLQRKMFPSPR